VSNAKRNFYYKKHIYRGDGLTSKHDDSYVYLLPFEHGKKFLLAQGYNGGTSHIGNNKYALDFMMPEGTKICAARGGEIVSIKEDSNEGGIGTEYENKGNYLEILHDDGTYGYYGHFQQNGVIVKLEDRVKPGDVIGYSGNTGRSGSPHLHFQVKEPKLDWQMPSVPVKFLNFDNSAVTLEPATFYYATHPMKPGFEVNLGRLITNQDYRTYSKPAVKNNKVLLSHERIDNTILFFVKNGRDENVEVTAGLKTMTNSYSSQPLPVTIRVPPLTEKYLFFIRRNPCKKPSDYKLDFGFQEYDYTFKVVD
jgi:murein DD-endopeptidase MepM/ murein hydrolase activator NlpD